MAVSSLDVRKFAEITDVCENAKTSQFWSRFQNLRQFFYSFVRGSFVAFSSSVAGSRLDCAVRTNRVLFASNDCASLQVLSSVELRLLSQWGRRRGLFSKSSFCFSFLFFRGSFDILFRTWAVEFELDLILKCWLLCEVMFIQKV